MKKVKSKKIETDEKTGKLKKGKVVKTKSKEPVKKVKKVRKVKEKVSSSGSSSIEMPDWLIPAITPDAPDTLKQIKPLETLETPEPDREKESTSQNNQSTSNTTPAIQSKSPLRLRYEKQQAEFEMVFHRVMDMIASGYAMTRALAELPIQIDHGAFRRWIKKNPSKNDLLKESEELRAEVWADRMLDHAEGSSGLEDVNRSKLIVDSYKWRIQVDNRRKYGTVTSVEMTGGISILNTLAAANSRIINLINDDNLVQDIDMRSSDNANCVDSMNSLDSINSLDSMNLLKITKNK